MKTLFFSFVLLFFVVPATAGDETKNIELHHVYAYATSAVQKNGAVFMQITNHTAQADKVISAQSDIAERVELHTHTMDGDIMMMRKVEHYTLPADETVTLEPMGHHIMFMGLHAPLKQGQSFPLTLNFEAHSPITTQVRILNPGEAP